VTQAQDDDFDGRVDRIRHFDAKGRLVSSDDDLNGDGIMETTSVYEDGILARRRTDSDGDGQADTGGFYKGDELLRTEIDKNGDGFRDEITIYDHGAIAREEVDRNGDGRPDVVSIYVHGQLDEKREDLDFDGTPTSSRTTRTASSPAAKPARPRCSRSGRTRACKERAPAGVLVRVAFTAVIWFGTAPLEALAGSEAQLARVNQVRAEHDLNPLRGSTELAAVALAHAKDMARRGYLARESRRPEPVEPRDRRRRVGLPPARREHRSVDGRRRPHRGDRDRLDGLARPPRER
jgi:hypothetical protein